jgi:hypothetical protein
LAPLDTYFAYVILVILRRAGIIFSENIMHSD